MAGNEVRAAYHVASSPWPSGYHVWPSSLYPWFESRRCLIYFLLSEWLYLSSVLCVFAERYRPCYRVQNVFVVKSLNSSGVMFARIARFCSMSGSVRCRQPVVVTDSGALAALSRCPKTRTKNPDLPVWCGPGKVIACALWKGDAGRLIPRSLVCPWGVAGLLLPGIPALFPWALEKLFAALGFLPCVARLRRWETVFLRKQKSQLTKRFHTFVVILCHF